MNIEKWLNIEEFPDYYISNFGRVKSLKRNRIMTLKLCSDIYGYSRINLYKNRKRYSKTVHRLVLEIFNPVEYMKNLQVNHIDGNKLNNNLENLEWCTHGENIKHAMKIGLTLRGEKHGMYGKHHSNEVKERISESNKGKLSGEKNPMYGKHHSGESKNRISESNKGKLSGEKNPLARLTNEKVLKIKNLSKNISCNEIAKIFNISNHMVYNIKSGRTWNSIN